MALVGYARVSSTDQDLTHQISVLTATGCRKIFSEKMTSTKKEGRLALDECLDYLREEDTLVITRIAACGTCKTWYMSLKSKTSNSGQRNTSSSSSKAFLDMLGVFAEFETRLRQERQREGITRAKSRGAYKEENQPPGRKRSRSLN